MRRRRNKGDDGAVRTYNDTPHERSSSYTNKRRSGSSSSFLVETTNISKPFAGKKHRQDTAEETLSEAKVQAVKRQWEDQEMYWDLNEKQLRTGHLPSIYNAALNNRTGWVTAANAIIKYRLPQLPTLHDPVGATEHTNLVGTFAHDLVTWMQKFAQTTVAYWKTTH